MHRVEVIVTIDRVKITVVGKLLLRDGRLVLETENCVDVVLLLNIGQGSPGCQVSVFLLA